MKLINRYPHGIPSTVRFIEVTGEDGTFYDLVNSHNVATHIKSLLADGYEAVVAARKDVPPCILRDFTDTLDTYTEVSYNGGGDFYHGGKREGAGRKPSGKRSRHIYVTDDEYQKLMSYIDTLRQSE